MYKSVLTLLLIMIVYSCSAQKSNPYENANPIPVKRFDQDLFKLINQQGGMNDAEIARSHPVMLEIFGKGVLNMQTPEQPGFFEKLHSYFSEPTLKGLYADAISEYEDIHDIQLELGYAFTLLKEFFPTMNIPNVYMHVSGFGQNVLVGDNILSISIDKYLGSNYHLYQQFFKPYQREEMQRANVAQDYLKGWIMSEYIFSGNEAVLLDRMIYEGKILYLLAQLLPDRTPDQLLGLTPKQVEWCENHEKELWRTIIERKHLYTPDRITTGRYLDETPANFLSDDAPGYIGKWIGWQIVSQYMNQTKESPNALMMQSKAQEILSLSNYNPF